MVKYVLLNINSILNNVRNNLTRCGTALLLYMGVKENE